MTEALQARAGKNASPKPFWFENATYSTHKSYELTQTGGPQLLIPGPPAPGSGSKNDPARAQDAPGQADLGSERYMGARSRLILGPVSNAIGILYGVSGTVAGNIVLVRPNGKAIVIGTIGPVAAGDAGEGVYTIPASPATTALGAMWCLAPGEDIVFIPNTGSGGSAAGVGRWIPFFVDVDLICFRQLLTTSKEIVMQAPPGKVWAAPSNVLIAGATGVSFGHHLGVLNLTPDPVDYTAFLNVGSGADIPFDGSVPGAIYLPLALGGFGTEQFVLPAGHILKLQLEDAADDVFFCGAVAEYNQADVTDETFATPTVITATPIP